MHTGLHALSESRPRTVGRAKGSFVRRLADPCPDLNLIASKQRTSLVRVTGKTFKDVVIYHPKLLWALGQEVTAQICPTPRSPVFLAGDQCGHSVTEQKGRMNELHNGVMNSPVSTHCLYSILRGTKRKQIGSGLQK